jgi:hypothetical protein
MRLAAIFCVWDDYDLLEHSVKNIEPLVDGVIIIASETSNYGIHSEIPDQWKDVFKWEPSLRLKPAENETRKRNYGLDIARKAGYTHFICMDADEFYRPDEFLHEKEKFHVNPDLAGLVCGSRVYFKSPTLTIGMDITRVPFIHRITPTLKHQFNSKYPFAFEGRGIRIDPTRQLNINYGVEWSEIVMHHMSYIRKDFKKKIKNSTARYNLENSTIMQDLALANEGVYCNFYGKVLERAPNYFNIPEYGVEVQDIQSNP